MTITYDMLETIIPNHKCEREYEELKYFGIFSNGILVDFKNEVPNELIEKLNRMIPSEYNDSIGEWQLFYNKVNNIQPSKDVNNLDWETPKMQSFFAQLLNMGASGNAYDIIEHKKNILTGKEQIAIGNISNRYSSQIQLLPDGSIRQSIKGKSIIVKMTFNDYENQFDFQFEGMNFSNIRIELTPMSSALYKLFCVKDRAMPLRKILDDEKIFMEFYNFYKFSEKVSDVKANSLLKKKGSSDTHFIGNKISDLNKELRENGVHQAFLLNRIKSTSTSNQDEFYYIPMFLSPKSKVTR